MAATADGDLHVYMVSVGQGDTTVIVSPQGKLIVIDAMRPAKIIDLLTGLGFDGTIEHLVVTHPHADHFGGANRLADDLTIRHATVAPFWHEFGMGPATYRTLIGRFDEDDVSTTFLAGYSRLYMDGPMTAPVPGESPEVDPDAPFLELLGPTNGLVRLLEDANVFNTNHLSIMTRLAWRGFRMISTGDCQMENWGFFDHERLMEDGCQVLRASHHGSPNGTQWERINRLSPSVVVVSSDPGAGHHLPDLTATAIFAKWNSFDSQMAVITRDAGTIHLTVDAAGNRSLKMFHDTPTGTVDLTNGDPLDADTNPTDWAALLADRVADL